MSFPQSVREFFTEAEFACKHCGEQKMDTAFLLDLAALRRECGFPFVVSSGYRCPVHNANVSTTGANGPHTTGRAVDIAVSGTRAMSLLRAAIGGGFTGIGVQQKGAGRFIHLDNLPQAAGRVRPAIWSY
jgi:uncharacterized protein YcbK (DUF882 family)